MTFKEIQDLIKLVQKSHLTEFKMKDGDFEVSIRTKEHKSGKEKIITTSQPIIPVPAPAAVAPATPAPAPAAPAAEVPAAKSEKKTAYLEIKSPMVGTFYRSSSPDKPSYVKVGDSIEVGSVVCIVEAMKLFNEIESEISGTIVKCLVEDASPVEYDQVLYLVDPS